MNSSGNGRRATDAMTAPAGTSDLVRQGMLLQQTSNTVAAVEYLQSRGIDSAIIRRVLNGRDVREDDEIALAAAWELRRKAELAGKQ